MRPGDSSLGRRIDKELRSFHRTRQQLRGISSSSHRDALVEQLVESVRRVKYVSVINSRDLCNLRSDPASDLFDPVRAAILQKRRKQMDEAYWFVFLFVHFGRHRKTGWRLARDVYGRLGNSVHWTWARISKQPKGFRRWLGKNQATLRGRDGITRLFGNHRKYESLDASSPSGTAAAVESYVSWVNPPRSHEMLVRESQERADGDPRETFDILYRSMSAVMRFGRTARFDYLSMVGKVGLASIEPGSAYLQNATGPLAGARLLFGGSKAAAISCAELDEYLLQLEADLSIGNYGMQVLEDALCNWQKSPGRFKPFRG